MENLQNNFTNYNTINVENVLNCNNIAKLLCYNEKHSTKYLKEFIKFNNMLLSQCKKNEEPDFNILNRLLTIHMEIMRNTENSEKNKNEVLNTLDKLKPSLKGKINNDDDRYNIGLELYWCSVALTEIVKLVKFDITLSKKENKNEFKYDNFINGARKFFNETKNNYNIKMNDAIKKYLEEKSIDNDTLLAQIHGTSTNTKQKKENEPANNNPLPINNTIQNFKQEKISNLKKIFNKKENINKNLLLEYFEKFKEKLKPNSDENIQKIKKEDIENLKQKIEMLKKQNENLENENKNLENIHKSILNNLHNLISIKNTTKHLKNEYEGFTKYNKSLTSENMHLKRRYEELKNENEDLKKNIKNLEKENENIKKENENFHPQINAVFQNEVNKHKIKKLNEEISSLEEYIELLKSENKRFSEQNLK